MSNSPTLRRVELLRALPHDLQLSRDALEADPRLHGTEIPDADLDDDGVVAGARELRALVARLDASDGRTDGRVRLRARSGGVAELVHAVAQHARAEALVERAASHRDPRAAITFVGLTDASAGEAARLRSRVPVHLIADLRGAETSVHVAGSSASLRSKESRRRFVDSLQLPSQVAGQVLAVLEDLARPDRAASGGTRALPEVAALASTWAAAYRDEAIPQRLVVSGHGTGELFFEAGQEGIHRDDLLALARAMPAAAVQIRHLHLASCQHGYQARMEPFWDAMPALESIWGYAGFSPSRWAAFAHQAVWEGATRDGDATDLDRTEVAGMRRGISASVWRRGEVWEGPDVEPLGDLHRRVVDGFATLQRFFRGEEEVSSPHEGFLPAYYQTLQELGAHHDFGDQSDAFRATARDLRELTLRLRFFPQVTRGLERHHGVTLDAGFLALGLPRVSLDGLERAEALELVRDFVAVYEEASPAERAEAAEAHALLTRGLRELDAEVVPDRWL